MRRTPRAVVLSFAVTITACATTKPTLVGSAAWTFDDVTLYTLPEGFVVDATRRVGPLATWEVVESRGAPSPRHALSLSYPNHKSYDSFNLCWNPAVAFQDGVITVRLCARSGKEDQGGGLMWRAASANDYYVARVNPLENNLRLYHVVGGNRTMLESADCNVKVGQWCELRVEHRGTKIRCGVDGSPLIEVDDATLTAPGGVGVWTKADAATDFDDLRVDAAPR